MLYFTEYQIIKYFSAMLCQNVVPQNKVMKLEKKKKGSHINLNRMFRLHLYFHKQLALR